jgi:hypothetical protein
MLQINDHGESSSRRDQVVTEQLETAPQYLLQDRRPTTGTVFGQSVITDIERNLAFFDRDVKSVQADVTKIEPHEAGAHFQSLRVEEVEVDAEMKSSGEWALKCSKSNRIQTKVAPDVSLTMWSYTFLRTG